MKAQFVYEGKAIDYKPVADVAAGDVVVQGNLIGVALLDIAANQQGALQITGVFEMVKVTGEGNFTVGMIAYWDVINLRVTIMPDDGGDPAIPFPCIGKIIEDAADADATVRVRLDG